MSSKNYQYVAYIDEAGDPGIDRVKPIDPKGSSEWLIMSGVLIRASNEPLVTAWDKQFRKVGGRQPSHQIHYRFLQDHQKVAVCEHLAMLPVRAFVVASNKKNMRRYRNDAAQRASEQLLGRLQSHNWMYHWLFRLLLERMSDYAVRKSASEGNPSATIKLEISRCGGIYYRELFAYLAQLKRHDIQGTQHLKQGLIRWPAIDFDLMNHFLHKTRSGLVLPDIVASAFFGACDRVDRGQPPNPMAAFKLDRVMARRSGRQEDFPVEYGVKLFPSFDDAELDHEQARIFQHSGYK